ncbi:MAG TPA: hypothetical protein VLB47_04720 [Solirubrobacteraceae bacterium]|nr:hypothetical protein [Solirubrobacteraceae bacterium]
MSFRQLLNDETACASYVFGCKAQSALAVVDPHVDLLDAYVAIAEAQGAALYPSHHSARTRSWRH